MDVEKGIESSWPLLRSRRRIPDILRNRELDGRSYGVYSISTIVGVEYIDDINAKTDSDINKCDITDIVVLPGSILVAIDRYNYAIKVIDTKRGMVISTKQNSYPQSITMITFNIVAINQPSEHKIEFAKWNSEIDIYKTIQFPRDVLISSISYHAGNLIVANYSKRMVEVRDLEGNLLRKVVDTSKSPYHVATSPGHDLCCVCTSGRVIMTRLNGDGNTVAEFVSHPRAVQKGTVDKNGNVYVTNYMTQSLHQVRAWSNKMIPLLPDGTLQKPKCITYSDADNRFYIGMQDSNTIKVYSGVYGLNVE